MTPTHQEIAGGPRGDGIGLFGSAMDASTGVDSGRIMAWQRPDTPSIELKKALVGLAIDDRISRKADGPGRFGELPSV